MTVDYMKHTLGYFHIYLPTVAEMNSSFLTSSPLMSIPSMSVAPITSMEFSGDSSSPLQPSKNNDTWSVTYLVRVLAVYNHWTGLVGWTSGLTLYINYFMVSNDTHSPVELCGSPAALFLAAYMVPEQITHCCTVFMRVFVPSV